ncbi:hypothetical protein HPB50_029379 [Hyalomma asiaticum]|nr:hypothetical protein HPB50_029379 [Hyalomma asiaticum]
MLNSTRQSTSAWTDWWSSLDPVTYNVVVYAIIIGGLVLSSMARTVAFFVMCMRASVNLHNRMFSCIIRAPIRFFDMNPIGELTPFVAFTCRYGSMSKRDEPYHAERVSGKETQVGKHAFCISHACLNQNHCDSVGLAVACRKCFRRSLERAGRVPGCYRRIDEFVSADDDVTIMGQLQDEDYVADVVPTTSQSDSNKEIDHGPLPTSSEVISALALDWRYCVNMEGCGLTCSDSLDNMEARVLLQAAKSLKQKKIQD